MTHVTKNWVGFGPWIAFKMGDMLERVMGWGIEFDGGEMFLFDSPKEGAMLLAQEEGMSPLQFNKDAPIGTVGHWAIDRILSELGKFKAPPRYDRYINVQEAETILCKWKSYRNGHYKLGEDLESSRASLLRFATVPLSQRLLKAGRKGGLWVR